MATSALGSFISLAVPAYIIGLLGIVPIGIEAKKLIELRKKDIDKVPSLKQKVAREEQIIPIFSGCCSL